LAVDRWLGRDTQTSIKLNRYIRPIKRCGTEKEYSNLNARIMYNQIFARNLLQLRAFFGAPGLIWVCHSCKFKKSMLIDSLSRQAIFWSGFRNSSPLQGWHFPIFKTERRTLGVLDALSENEKAAIDHSIL
jgi:hypothetical protein